MSRHVVYFCMVLLLSVCACQGVHAAETGEVECKSLSDGGDWLVFQRRVSYSDFYQDWNTYRTGFGDLKKNFWLGLDNIHYNCNEQTKCQLCIEMEYKGIHYYAKYNTFYLDEDFKLHVDGYSGTAGDNLNYHNNQPFSTYDNDNDNCAGRYRGGWWYKDCHQSNLNGEWGSTEQGVGLNWEEKTGYFASVSKSEMKLRVISKFE